MSYKRYYSSLLLFGVVLGWTILPRTTEAHGLNSSVHHRVAGTSKTAHRSHHRLAVNGGEVIVFGQEGGNIRPWSVGLSSAGAVVARGPATVRSQALAATTDTLNGLVRLAEAEGFFSLPPRTQCAGTLPDIASRFIAIRTVTGVTRVSVHGGCTSAFNQLFAVLMATAGMS